MVDKKAEVKKQQLLINSTAEVPHKSLSESAISPGEKERKPIE